jgi:hypothetical protein
MIIQFNFENNTQIHVSDKGRLGALVKYTKDQWSGKEGWVQGRE